MNNMTANPAGTAGLLIVGMHRSGTSALSRILELGGANIGDRLVGGSAGNAAGHFEDAFAVEVHERLLSAFGTRWDEPFGLPREWAASELAADAQARILHYLKDDRRRHRFWAVKDPRLSLFANLWLGAAREARADIGVVHLVRHPAEVAASLEARDGIGFGTAMLLWFDYTLSALVATRGVSATYVTYPQLLADWRACIDRIGDARGVAAIAFDAEAATRVDAFLSKDLRHHEAEGAGPSLPVQVDALWRYLVARADGQPAAAGEVEALASSRDALAALIVPFVRDRRAETRTLWERAGHAEAAVVRLASAPDALDLHFEELRARLERQQAALVGAMSALSLDMLRTGPAHAEFAELRARGDAQSQNVEASLGEVRERMDRHAASVFDAVSASTAANERIAQSSGDALGALRETMATGAEVILQAVDRSQALQTERDALTASVAEQSAKRVALASSLASSEEDLAQARARLDFQHTQLMTTLRERDELRQRAETLSLVLHSSSWRLTRPLRSLRRMLSPSQSVAEMARLGRAVASRLAAMRFVPAAMRERLARSAIETRSPAIHRPLATEVPTELAPQRDGLPDIFVWAVIDWNFRTQRPQHLSRALAEQGHRVFYISNNFAHNAEPGFALTPLDSSGCLFQIHLNLCDAAGIYYGMPDPASLATLQRSLGALLAWCQGSSAVSIVQHPYWEKLASSVHNVQLVYDCMDHHGGFENNASDVLAAEERLISHSDLLVVTSNWLASELGHKARNVTTVRNATDYAYFSVEPDHHYRDSAGRKVIGYYGAVAEWFDLALVRRIARAYPQAHVVIVGGDTIGAAQQLVEESNVTLVGEVPYADLGYWLYGFDVCILPFKVIPLTLATNPVKVYEYLSAGKPVVSVDLPELAEFGGLVAIAADGDEFVRAVGDAIAHPDRDEIVDARRRFASQQTWAHRARSLQDSLAAIKEPRVSVIVLTYNNLAFTQACLFSIEAYSDYGNLEVVVVDNASSDGSRDWLEQWGRGQGTDGPMRRVIFNEANLGFSAGNNVGLLAATGEILVLLNNDTYVTPGWLRTLCWHLRRETKLGLVGPVTNNIGNEARIEIAYTDMPEMIREAASYTRRNAGRGLAVDTAAFFCVAMRREVYEAVGPMDEDFGVGFFEDDDYCNRVRALGYEVACADDVFVHHHLSASFDQLRVETKQKLFERNRLIYERKWGPWTPHVYRDERPDR